MTHTNNPVVRTTRTIDHTGQTFGRLTVVGRAGNYGRGEATWACKCECGAERIVRGSYLRSGHTQSCGCLHGEIVKASKRTHGLYAAMYHKYGRLGRIWQAMTQRCYDAENIRYPDYGGRGISIEQDEWRTAAVGNEACKNFVEWALANGYEDGLQIDRIDNGHGYSEDNCQWVTAKQNAGNRRCRKDSREKSHKSQSSQVHTAASSAGEE